MKGKMAIQKMVVNMMELYVYRLKQKRTPYPQLSAAMEQFAGQFHYCATPDQERVRVLDFSVQLRTVSCFCIIFYGDHMSGLHDLFVLLLK